MDKPDECGGFGANARDKAPASVTIPPCADPIDPAAVSPRPARGDAEQPSNARISCDYPSWAAARLSDRAARRLFERLVDLGAVRELSGRPNFCLDGLY